MQGMSPVLRIRHVRQSGRIPLFRFTRGKECACHFGLLCCVNPRFALTDIENVDTLHHKQPQIQRMADAPLEGAPV